MSTDLPTTEAEILAAEDATHAEWQREQIAEWDAVVKAVVEPESPPPAAETFVIRGHHPHCRNTEDCNCADEREPCDCLAYDREDNDHTWHEHVSCGGQLCGGCDSCISAQVRYWQNRPPITATRYIPLPLDGPDPTTERP